MDTPENTSQIEYFGPEATARNSELVYGKTVRLIRDVSETDRYGRLLRYVIAEDVFVNYELVAQGYANAASYPPDIACIPTFQAVEQQASTAKLGLWGAPPTQIVVLPLPTAFSGGSSGGSLGSSGGNAPCNCSGPDLDCGDFSTHASAQACYDHCVALGFGNIFRLDGNDNDGLACESLP
jgi:micrococcal nuclease